MSKLVVVVVGLFGLVPPGSDNEIVALLRSADGSDVVVDTTANTSVTIPSHIAEIAFDRVQRKGVTVNLRTLLKGGDISFRFSSDTESVAFSNEQGFLDFLSVLRPDNLDARVRAACVELAPADCSQNGKPLLAGRLRLEKGVVHPITISDDDGQLVISRTPSVQVPDLARVGTNMSAGELNLVGIANAALFEAQVEGDEVVLLVDGREERLIPASREALAEAGISVRRGEKVFLVWITNSPPEHSGSMAGGEHVDNHFALLYDFLTEPVANPLVPFVPPLCEPGSGNDCLPPGSQCVPPKMPEVEGS